MMETAVVIRAPEKLFGRNLRRHLLHAKCLPSFMCRHRANEAESPAGCIRADCALWFYFAIMRECASAAPSQLMAPGI